MRRAALAMTVAANAVVLVNTPAAHAAACQSDGVATLCASSRPSQDALSLEYQVTQTDGPGVYTVYNVDTSTGAVSATQNIGPLGYQAVASGRFLVPFNRCYDIHLESTANTSVVVGQVCG